MSSSWSPRVCYAPGVLVSALWHCVAEVWYPTLALRFMSVHIERCHCCYGHAENFP